MELKQHLADILKAADGKHAKAEKRHENLGSINPT